MEEMDLVKFREPLNEDERNALMVVLENRGERVLVSDLRFAYLKIPPTNTYLASDLEIVSEERLPK